LFVILKASHSHRQKGLTDLPVWGTKGKKSTI
jgi:hypothetical protein